MRDVIEGVLNRLNYQFDVSEEDTMLTVVTVTTPFLDRRNDPIQFYITNIDGDHFKLSDDGYISSEFTLNESLFIYTDTAQLIAHELGIELVKYYGRWEVCCGFGADLNTDLKKAVETRILQYVQALIIFEGLLCLPIDQYNGKIYVQ